VCKGNERTLLLHSRPKILKCIKNEEKDEKNIDQFKVRQVVYSGKLFCCEGTIEKTQSCQSAYIFLEADHGRKALG